MSAHLTGMDGVVTTLRPARSRRFWCEAGSDQIIMDGRKIDHEDAADLITTWRDQAERTHSAHFRKMLLIGADDLQAALTQARNWRRCQDPSARVGFAALAASVAVLGGE